MADTRTTETAPTKRIEYDPRAETGRTVYELDPFTTSVNPHSKLVINRHKSLSLKSSEENWEPGEHKDDWKALDLYAQLASIIAFKDNPVDAPLPPTIIWLDGEKDPDKFDNLVDDFIHTDSKDVKAMNEKLDDCLDFWLKRFVTKPLK